MDGLGTGAAEFAVREEDGGVGAVLVVGFEVVAVGGEGVFVLPFFIPDEGGGVAVEVSFLDVIKGGDGFPVALVIGAPEVFFGVDTESVVHAEAGGDGGEFVFGIEMENPATVFHAGEVAPASSGFGIFVLGVEKGGAVV